MGLRAGLLGVLPALAACTMGQSYDAAMAPTMAAQTVAAGSTRKVAILRSEEHTSELQSR